MAKGKGKPSLVMTVPEAGALLDLGRNASYAAAARGEIPTIRLGNLLKVPVALFERMLDQPASWCKSTTHS